MEKPSTALDWPTHRSIGEGVERRLPLDSGRSGPLLETYLSKRAVSCACSLFACVPPQRPRISSRNWHLKVQSLSGVEVSSPVAFLYKLGANLMLDKLRKGADRWRATTNGTPAAVSLVGGNDAVDEPSAEGAWPLADD